MKEIKPLTITKVENGIPVEGLTQNPLGEKKPFADVSEIDSEFDEDKADKWQQAENTRKTFKIVQQEVDVEKLAWNIIRERFPFMTKESDRYSVYESLIVSGYNANHPNSLSGKKGFVAVDCKERLPNNNKDYFVFDPNGFNKNKKTIARFDTYNKSWYIDQDTIHPDYWLEESVLPIQGFSEEKIKSLLDSCLGLCDELDTFTNASTNNVDVRSDIEEFLESLTPNVKIWKVNDVALCECFEDGTAKIIQA